MTWLSLWMRVVGAFYLILFVGNVFLQVAPDVWLVESVRADTPDETLQFLVDTWVMFGLYQGVIGIALVYFSRHISEAMPVFWMVIGFELFGGIVHDVYMLAHGQAGSVLLGLLGWIVIHALIIGTGFLALRRVTESIANTSPAGAAV